MKHDIDKAAFCYTIATILVVLKVRNSLDWILIGYSVSEVMDFVKYVFVGTRT
jgi:hypothetical protein